MRGVSRRHQESRWSWSSYGADAFPLGVNVETMGEWHAVKIKHMNGETYTGDFVTEDEHRVWIRDAKGTIWQIMKADIVGQTK
jgi:hypothetical protein